MNSTRPLDGRTVVITRSAEQARELTRRLEQLGARVLLIPAVTFSEPDDWAPVDRAVAALADFDWVLFTSANAVRLLASRCRQLDVNPATVKGPRYAAVGSATAEAAAAKGFMISYTARKFLGAALARELGPALAGKRVLLPRSDRAGRDLPDALASAGAYVTEVIAYKTGGMGDVAPETLASLRRGEFDVITFFSPSTIENLRDELGAELFSSLVTSAVIAAIGPATAAVLRRYGWRPAIEAPQATADSMAAAIAGYFARQPVQPARSR